MAVESSVHSVRCGDGPLGCPRAARGALARRAGAFVASGLAFAVPFVVALALALAPVRAEAAPADPAGTAAPAARAGGFAGAGETVKVGLLGNLPPFHQWPADAPTPTGLDADLLAEIAQRTGLVFAFRRYADFDALQAGLRRGEVRVTTAIAQTPERARTLRFTRPYASVHQAFVGPAVITSVPATPDLSGRRLGLVSGHASQSIAVERFPLAQRVVYATLDEAMDALAAGEIDFAFELLPTLRALAAERPAAGLAVLRTYGFPEGQLRLAVRVADGPLAQQLDGALAAVPADTLRALRERWIPPTPAPAVRPLPGGLPPLRVGFLPGDYPFTLGDDAGQASGLAIEMMRAVARRAGVEITGFVPKDLAAGLAGLADGSLDAMLGLTDTAERRASMTFVGPYRANPLVIISRKQYSIWDLHQLAEQRLAVVRGYFGTPYVRATYPTMRIVECARFDDCLAMVEEGRAEATLYGMQGAFARVGARIGSSLQVTGTVPGLYDEHNLGLSLARAGIATRLRDALVVVQAEDMPAIERAWAAQENQGRIDWAMVRRSAAGGAAALALLALGWWWHSRRLRREIERTRAAQQASERYLAFMAHEVRNALQSVNGAVAMLRGSSDPGHRQWPVLDALAGSARSTLGLLNGLLDRHRLQAGRLVPQPLPEQLVPVLAAVADECRNAAEAKGLELAFEPGAALDGWWMLDALRLQQIVRNLLVNAVKFSPRGRIVLSAELLPLPARGAGWFELRVAVSDEGPGIAAADLPRLMQGEPLARGDRPGSGLGLQLCRELAAAFDGRLDIASEAGAGSRFTLGMPLARAVAPPPAAGATLQRLLVVEDSAVYALLLRQAFEVQGSLVSIADSVAQARRLLIASVAGAGAMAPPFDLVLSDTWLPDGSVEDLAGFMAQDVRPGVRMPPLIAMSADFDEATLARLQALGALELLAKDSDVAAFAQRVQARFQRAARPAAAQDRAAA